MNYLNTTNYYRPTPGHKKTSTCHLLPKHRASQSIDFFNSAQNSQGLLLLGRTILQNQRQYNRIWTEKQHEKEIQEILLRKERRFPRSMEKRSMENLLVEEDPLVKKNNIKKLEGNECLTLLEETANYLKSSQGWVEILKQLEKGRLFTFPKATSEVSDLIDKILEEHRIVHRKDIAEIKMLEEVNLDLSTKLKRSNELLEKATARIEELETNLNKTEWELTRRARVIVRLNKRIEEQETANNTDYTKLKEMLKQTLEEKKIELLKERSTKDNSFFKLSEKTIAIPLVDQSCGTEYTELLTPEINNIKSIMAIPKVQLFIGVMLKPEELSLVVRSSKVFHESLMGNSRVASHLVNQLIVTARIKITNLECSLEKLADNDKRFSFFKDKTSDPEFIKLVDEYICKKRPLGTTLIQPLISSRNFMYSGEMEKMEKKEGGIFSGWSLGSILGLNSQVKETRESVEKELEEIIIGEKETNPEKICTILNKVAARIGNYHPEKMSRWINQLQLCFGMLFKGAMEFYVEMKNVEKIKNFLINRVEEFKKRLLDIKKQNQDIAVELKNVNEVY